MANPGRVHPAPAEQANLTVFLKSYTNKLGTNGHQGREPERYVIALIAYFCAQSTALTTESKALALRALIDAIDGSGSDLKVRLGQQAHPEREAYTDVDDLAVNEQLWLARYADIITARSQTRLFQTIQAVLWNVARLSFNDRAQLAEAISCVHKGLASFELVAVQPDGHFPRPETEAAGWTEPEPSRPAHIAIKKAFSIDLYQDLGPVFEAVAAFNVIAHIDVERVASVVARIDAAITNQNITDLTACTEKLLVKNPAPEDKTQLARLISPAVLAVWPWADKVIKADITTLQRGKLPTFAIKHRQLRRDLEQLKNAVAKGNGFGESVGMVSRGMQIFPEAVRKTREAEIRSRQLISVMDSMLVPSVLGNPEKLRDLNDDALQHVATLFGYEGTAAGSGAAAGAAGVSKDILIDQVKVKAAQDDQAILAFKACILHAANEYARKKKWRWQPLSSQRHVVLQDTKFGRYLRWDEAQNTFAFNEATANLSPSYVLIDLWDQSTQQIADGVGIKFHTALLTAIRTMLREHTGVLTGVIHLEENQQQGNKLTVARHIYDLSHFHTTAASVAVDIPSDTVRTRAMSVQSEPAVADLTTTVECHKALQEAVRLYCPQNSKTHRIAQTTLTAITDLNIGDIAALVWGRLGKASRHQPGNESLRVLLMNELRHAGGKAQLTAWDNATIDRELSALLKQALLGNLAEQDPEVLGDNQQALVNLVESTIAQARRILTDGSRFKSADDVSVIKASALINGLNNKLQPLRNAGAVINEERAGRVLAEIRGEIADTPFIGVKAARAEANISFAQALKIKRNGYDCVNRSKALQQVQAVLPETIADPAPGTMAPTGTDEATAVVTPAPVKIDHKVFTAASIAASVRHTATSTTVSSVSEEPAVKYETLAVALDDTRKLREFGLEMTPKDNAAATRRLIAVIYAAWNKMNSTSQASFRAKSSKLFPKDGRPLQIPGFAAAIATLEQAYATNGKRHGQTNRQKALAEAITAAGFEFIDGKFTRVLPGFKLAYRVEAAPVSVDGEAVRRRLFSTGTTCMDGLGHGVPRLKTEVDADAIVASAGGR